MPSTSASSFSVNSLLGTGEPAQTYYVGAGVLPDYLTEKAYPSKPGVPQAVPAAAGSWWEDLADQGLEWASGAWETAKSYKALYDYYSYSQTLSSSFIARKAPYEIERYVYDARGRAILPNEAALARKEGGPVSSSPAANNAYEYSGFIFEFFKEHLGFVIPQPMLQIVNYNDDAQTLGFDNAYFNPMGVGLNIMVYGTGDGRFFKSFDQDITVIAHELAHNFLSEKYPGKFTYMGHHYDQAGALNEHIADVIAKCVEAKYYGWDDLVEHWFIGANLMVNPNYSLRDMAEPGSAYNDPVLGKDPQPAHMKDFIVTEKDHAGVHLNNGIMNRVFTLFAENVGGAVYDIPLLVWLKAIAMVKHVPTFLDFSQALQVAAREYGVESEFLDAARKVGVLEYVVLDGQVQRLHDGGMRYGESDVSLPSADETGFSPLP